MPTHKLADLSNTSPYQDIGLQAIRIEKQGLIALESAMKGALGASFSLACEIINKQSGRLVISGMGKSGHIGRKIAATMASTGTPAFFVHPGEASHGDLGMVTSDDAILALSWSGETQELRDLLHHAHRFNIPLIAITSNPESALAKAATVALVLPKAIEACPNGLAPTTSTTMQLAMGDALAVALLESKGFSASDFRVFHPGGKLGAALVRVSDIMHKGEYIPLVSRSTPVSDVVITMSVCAVGCVGVTNDKGSLVGVITDGDLRRHMSDNLLSLAAQEIMTLQPHTVVPDMIATEALNIMNTSKITALFVVQNDKPVGVLHVHDMLRIGVV